MSAAQLENDDQYSWTVEREQRMSGIDPFGKTDRLDEATQEALVTRFEARGQHPLFLSMLNNYLDAMCIDDARLVLDAGCGTGLAARAIARRPGFSGRVRGIDLSPYLVEAARRLAAEEGIAERIDFAAGNMQGIAIADETFDAVVAHTLLSHVEDPLAVLKEIARILRVGGTVAIFDGDYASLTFHHPDPIRAKANDEAVIMAVVANPRIMRQMPRLLRAVGLEFVASYAHVLSEIGRANFWLSAIETFRKLIPKSGVMTADEADAWAAGLRSDSEAGVFFGSSNYYAYIARRL
jgi:ubiquinone/menaquinone biosynthesis C-methylase UbiE